MVFIFTRIEDETNFSESLRIRINGSRLCWGATYQG